MRIYISGSPVLDKWSDREAAVLDHRLFSMASDYVPRTVKWIEFEMSRRPNTIMLDSGAFSAWNKGISVSVEEVIKNYYTFLNESEKAKISYKEVWMINLDIIPGVRGKTATPKQVAEAVRQSDVNFEILRKEFGDRIMPIAHQDEPMERIKEVGEQAEYICLSPRNDLHEVSRAEWAMWAHSLIGDRRTHGLATTGLRITSMAPWFSVDSATPIMLAAYGQIMINMERKYQIVFISKDSSQIDKRGKHYNSLSKFEQDMVAEQAKAAGFTVEEVKGHFRPRHIMNLHAMALHATRMTGPKSAPHYQVALF